MAGDVMDLFDVLNMVGGLALFLYGMHIMGGGLELSLIHIFTCNKNTIPFDPASPFVTSGIRLGTPAVTTRGMKEEDMREIAAIIAGTLKDFESFKEEAIRRVDALTKKYPLYE